ncbi:hypothetical protein SPFCAV_04625 [Salmonella enterica subsp. enterica serovar Gallinarum/Pullorum str. FCAV198]|nr:hypothetical protein SPFCAV_04625 [Salmonella enterica subsp. enterica serovar Gallinarum/Pullorum str. FCAV198]
MAWYFALKSQIVELTFTWSLVCHSQFFNPISRGPPAIRQVLVFVP